MFLTGITVQLAVESSASVDGFGRPIKTETFVDVENVLVSPVSGEEMTDTLNLTGKRAVYQLAIPKDDSHDWENKHIKFFGETWRSIGKPTEGIEALIPLQWNKKVKVESLVAES